jgi:hypothetical protein
MEWKYSLFRGDVTSSNNNESAIFRRSKSNLKWQMFHRLNDKGDDSLTEIPGCPEKRIQPHHPNVVELIIMKDPSIPPLSVHLSLK